MKLALLGKGRRVRMMEDRGGTPYLSAEDTLLDRVRRKLVEKCTWYKGWEQQKKETTRERLELESARNRALVQTVGERDEPRVARTSNGNLEILAPMFVERTNGGALLKALKEVEDRVS